MEALQGGEGRGWFRDTVEKIRRILIFAREGERKLGRCSEKNKKWGEGRLNGEVGRLKRV